MPGETDEITFLHRLSAFDRDGAYLQVPVLRYVAVPVIYPQVPEVSASAGVRAERRITNTCGIIDNSSICHSGDGCTICCYIVVPGMLVVASVSGTACARINEIQGKGSQHTAWIGRFVVLACTNRFAVEGSYDCITAWVWAISYFSILPEC